MGEPNPDFQIMEFQLPAGTTGADIFQIKSERSAKGRPFRTGLQEGPYAALFTVSE